MQKYKSTRSTSNDFEVIKTKAASKMMEINVCDVEDIITTDFTYKFHIKQDKLSEKLTTVSTAQNSECEDKNSTGFQLSKSFTSTDTDDEENEADFSIFSTQAAPSTKNYFTPEREINYDYLCKNGAEEVQKSTTNIFGLKSVYCTPCDDTISLNNEEFSRQADEKLKQIFSTPIQPRAAV